MKRPQYNPKRTIKRASSALDARFVTFFATIEGFSLLDSSLPAAVRTHYLFVVSFAAAGSKAHHKLNGQGAASGEKSSIVTFLL